MREWVVPTPDGEPADSFADSTRAASARSPSEVLRIVEPQFNHNGGGLFFGTAAADRNLLYITSGDGGCADDQNGQAGLAGEGPCITATRAGATPSGSTTCSARSCASTRWPVVVPPTRPPGRHLADGFRNPFRASSDRADLGGTGRVWTADVGQNQLEEVDARIVPGGNYGWRVKEGTFRFDPAGSSCSVASDGFVFANSPGAPAGLIDPVAQYDHDEGVATIGGFVYRGTALPS